MAGGALIHTWTRRLEARRTCDRLPDDSHVRLCAAAFTFDSDAQAAHQVAGAGIYPDREPEPVENDHRRCNIAKGERCEVREQRSLHEGLMGREGQRADRNCKATVCSRNSGTSSAAAEPRPQLAYWRHVWISQGTCGRSVRLRLTRYPRLHGDKRCIR